MFDKKQKSPKDRISLRKKNKSNRSLKLDFLRSAFGDRAYGRHCEQLPIHEEEPWNSSSTIVRGEVILCVYTRTMNQRHVYYVT